MRIFRPGATKTPCPRPNCKGVLVGKTEPDRYVCGMCCRVYSVEDRARVDRQQAVLG